MLKQFQFSGATGYDDTTGKLTNTILYTSPSSGIFSIIIRPIILLLFHFNANMNSDILLQTAAIFFF